MDELGMIPVQSVLFMCISMGIMVLLPTGYMAVAWILRKASVLSGILGILGFVLSFCTYGLLWCLYVVIVSGGFVTTNLPMSYYMVYAVFVGVFSALWMFFLWKKPGKKQNRPWDSMCFYAGFALANGIRLCLPIIDNVRLTNLYNQIGIVGIRSSMDSSESQLALEKLYQISIKESSYFLINGLEAILLFITFLAMGYLLVQVVASSKKQTAVLLLLLLVCLQFMTELPTQLLRTTSLGIESKEVILACLACVAVGIDLLLIFKRRMSGHGNSGNAKKDAAD